MLGPVVDWARANTMASGVMRLQWCVDSSVAAVRAPHTAPTPGERSFKFGISLTGCCAHAQVAMCDMQEGTTLCEPLTGVDNLSRLLLLGQPGAVGSANTAESFELHLAPPADDAHADEKGQVLRLAALDGPHHLQLPPDEALLRQVLCALAVICAPHLQLVEAHVQALRCAARDMEASEVRSALLCSALSSASGGKEGSSWQGATHASCCVCSGSPSVRVRHRRWRCAGRSWRRRCTGKKGCTRRPALCIKCSRTRETKPPPRMTTSRPR